MLIILAKINQKTNFYRKISYAKINHYKKLYIDLFDDSELIFHIAKATRILPHYFNQKYIMRFMNSPNIDNYIYHIEKKTSSSSPNLQSLIFDNRLQFFSKHSYTSIQKIQAYLNYLINEEDLERNHQIMELLDLRSPHNWFYQTRKIKRHFIYHHGPTNSGKTHSAIEQLKNLSQQQKGIYMAPLRMLAWQVQQKLNHCNLITGQQKQYRNSNLTSCTIESLSFNDQYDIAVIDEIQMIADPQRGWSWTRALLGIKAKRIHLCGQGRALGLIKKILQITGDLLQQKNYYRRSKLKLLQSNFYYKNIKSGDCLIDFKYHNLYKYRQRINKQLSKDQQDYENKCAIIYGKLPPSCRKTQAKLFNERTLPYLIATNAIGMGLNLNINKIVFLSLEKMKGIYLQDHEIIQIAGRAGRNSNTGFVQCANQSIQLRVLKALQGINQTYGMAVEQTSDQNLEKPQQEIEIDKKIEEISPLARQLTAKQNEITKAGILMNVSLLQMLKESFENLLKRTLSLSQIMIMFLQLSEIDSEMYFIQDYNNILEIADLLQNVKLDFEDQYIFATIPSMKKLKGSFSKWIYQFAENFKNKGRVSIPHQIHKDSKIDFEIEIINQNKIKLLQEYYAILDIYLWLWGKYQMAFFQEREARIIQAQICNKIDELLVDSVSKNNNKNQENIATTV